MLEANGILENSTFDPLLAKHVTKRMYFSFSFFFYFFFLFFFSFLFLSFLFFFFLLYFQTITQLRSGRSTLNYANAKK